MNNEELLIRVTAGLFSQSYSSVKPITIYYINNTVYSLMDMVLMCKWFFFFPKVKPWMQYFKMHLLWQIIKCVKAKLRFLQKWTKRENNVAIVSFGCLTFVWSQQHPCYFQAIIRTTSGEFQISSIWISAHSRNNSNSFFFFFCSYFCRVRKCSSVSAEPFISAGKWAPEIFKLKAHCTTIT